MTREVAIEILKHITTIIPSQDVTMDEVDTALEMAIQALSQEPCDKCKYFDGNSCQHYDYKVGYTQGYEDANNRFRQEPCDKCEVGNPCLYCEHEFSQKSEPMRDFTEEEAKAYSKALEKMADYVASGYADSVEDFEEYSRIICQLPSVTQKSGKWIKDECGNVICSECKRFRRDCRYGHTNYCNHCGCRMVEPQESEEQTE